MLVSGVLFVLFDIVATMLIVSTVVRLAASRRSRRARTWPATTRTLRSRVMPSHAFVYRHADWADADASFARHPAGRFRKAPLDGFAGPKGPDDDPEFLHALERRIRQMRGESTD
ncbi:MAG: hypothetical protein ACRDN0_30635 [Trebonia sp.]